MLQFGTLQFFRQQLKLLGCKVKFSKSWDYRNFLFFKSKTDYFEEMYIILWQFHLNTSFFTCLVRKFFSFNCLISFHSKLIPKIPNLLPLFFFYLKLLFKLLSSYDRMNSVCLPAESTVSYKKLLNYNETKFYFTLRVWNHKSKKIKMKKNCYGNKTIIQRRKSKKKTITWISLHLVVGILVACVKPIIQYHSLKRFSTICEKQE